MKTMQSGAKLFRQMTTKKQKAKKLLSLKKIFDFLKCQKHKHYIFQFSDLNRLRIHNVSRLIADCYCVVILT